MMFDPDAPVSKARGLSYLHWLQTNINVSTNTSVNEDTNVAYQGPAPPRGSGDHNYIFSLLKQKNKIDAGTNYDRTAFDPVAFVNKYGLSKFAERMFIASNKN